MLAGNQVGESYNETGMEDDGIRQDSGSGVISK